ncbi:unnamed protein product [Echinostoma caproni]|uniref:NAD(P)H oxidase (H(2)O(2)-forming) n=1 Tax=Echinostoma caproni TaxID=27848 RepID=A0A183BCI5_9TREM|nr:unnamed protein product [Echinostoma caproni]
MRAVKAIGKLATLWPHLRDLYFKEADHPQVDLLKGYNVPEAHWLLDQRLGGRKEPYAARNIFGGALFGSPHATNRKLLSFTFTTTTTAGDDTIKRTFQRMYDNEFDDMNDQKGGPSVEDNQAFAIVKTRTRCPSDRFEVPLPWRTGYNRLPNNHGMALKWLKYFKRRLVMDAKLRRQCAAAMQWNEQLRYTERVDVSLPPTGKRGFRLIKWLSSWRLVIDNVSQTDRASGAVNLTTQPLSTEPALGLRWSAESDEFIFQIRIPERNPTWRGQLSSVSSLYDPLGFEALWLSPGKVFLQQLCRSGTSH